MLARGSKIYLISPFLTIDLKIASAFLRLSRSKVSIVENENGGTARNIMHYVFNFVCKSQMNRVQEKFFWSRLKNRKATTKSTSFMYI